VDETPQEPEQLKQAADPFLHKKLAETRTSFAISELIISHLYD